MTLNGEQSVRIDGIPPRLTISLWQVIAIRKHVRFGKGTILVLGGTRIEFDAFASHPDMLFGPQPLDDGVRAFCAGFGFQELPFDPARSMAVRIVDQQANGF